MPRKELVGSTSEAGADPTSGLFMRAQYFYENAAASKTKHVAGAQSMLNQFGASSAAWILALQDLTPRQRAGRPLALHCINVSLAMQTGTQTVERFLGEVKLTELKHRSGALGPEALDASLKLNTQCFTGRRLGKSFDPGELIQSITASGERDVRYRSSQYALKVQNAYREMFGEKKSSGRSLEQESGHRDAEKPRLNKICRRPVSSDKAETFRSFKEKHSQVVSKLVASADKTGSLGPVVEAHEAVLVARQSAAAAEEASSSSSRKRPVADVDELVRPQEHDVQEAEATLGLFSFQRLVVPLRFTTCYFKVHHPALTSQVCEQFLAESGRAINVSQEKRKICQYELLNVSDNRPSS